MRIMIIDPLFFTLSYDRGLCAGLAQAGHDVCIVARPAESGEIWDVPSVRHVHLKITNIFRRSDLAGLRMRIFSAWRHLRYGLQIQAVERLAREWNADVVHFQWCLTPYAELALITRLRRNYKVIYTVHDTTTFNGGAVSAYLTLGLGKLTQKFDRLIVHTDSGAAALSSKGISPEKISKVPHGPLGTEYQHKSDTEKEHSNTATINFLLLGIMKPYKGIDILIRAAALLSQDLKSRCRFTVAGRPEMNLNDLKTLCKECGVEELFFFDARYIPDEEISKLCDDADVFVFPYRAIEASGIFYTVAQFGRPMIASRIGIFQELIVERQHGLLVEPDNPVELADAIRYMISNRAARLEMGRNVLGIGAAISDWYQIALSTCAEYEKVNRATF